MTDEVEFAGGKVTSSRVPPLHLIPTVCLERTAERFRLGVERKGDKAWNAISSNQDVLKDIPFLIERTAHIVQHAMRLRDKLLSYRDDPAAGLALLAEDDDASAIVWGGMFLQAAGEALKGVQEARPCVLGEKTTAGSGEPAGASEGDSEYDKLADGLGAVSKLAGEAFRHAKAVCPKLPADADAASKPVEWVMVDFASRETGVPLEAIRKAVFVEGQVRSNGPFVVLGDVQKLACKLAPADPDAEVEAAAGRGRAEEEEWVSFSSAALACGISVCEIHKAVILGDVRARSTQGGSRHVRLSDVRWLAERLRREGET